MKLLVTGGAGFIGSNFIRQLLTTRRDIHVVNFDKLTYAGNPESLSDLASDSRYDFVRGDINDPAAVSDVFKRGFDAVVNFAAETHVDRSIEDASPFLRTNVSGTQCLLEAARASKLPRFVQISTDEVYGSAPAGGSFTEETILDPRSPYAASKASADHFVTAYANTYGVSAIILRCTNNYGPFQFPRKIDPLDDCQCPGKQIASYLRRRHAGTRLALRRRLLPGHHSGRRKRKAGEVYNVSAGTPQPNLNIVKTILRHLGKPESLMQYVKDRPGHDRRYALDSSKIQRELGWKPQVSFEDGIRRTIDWYRSNSLMARARALRRISQLLRSPLHQSFGNF